MIRTMKIRALFIALILLPGTLWAEEKIVSEVTDFGELDTHTNNSHYTLTNGTTYILNAGVTTLGYLYIEQGSNVVIDLNGNKIDRNLNTRTTNGFVIRNEGTLTIKNTGDGAEGKITGGYNFGSGGGIYNKGNLTIEGGTITGNKAEFNNSTVQQIGHGGGIMVESGSLHLKGGIITGNKSSIGYTLGGQGGGVYINSGATLTIEGAPQITGNIRYSDEKKNNIYLTSGVVINIGTSGLTDANGTIGISMQALGTITSGLNSAEKYSVFVSDDNHFETAANGTEVQLYTCWMGLVNRFNNGGDIELSSSKVYEASSSDPCLTVPSEKTVTLNLNGQTLNRRLTAAKEDGCVIKNLGTLNITTSDGIITGGYNSTGGGGIHNMGTLTMSTGQIKSNKSTNQGGGVYNTGSMTLSGGTITTNEANNTNGGGIYNTGTLTISGGKINSNSATGTSRNGGGIYNAGTLSISGGEIKSNTATGLGAGIYHDGATFSLQGAPDISGNASNNVYLTTDHHIITVNGTLSNTTAIGITMQTLGIFTSGLSTKGSINNFSSEADNSVALVANNGEAELITCWNYLKRQLAAGVSPITLASGTYRSTGSSDDYLHVPSDKTVVLNLNGQTLNRNLSSATNDGCVIYNQGTLTINGSGTIRGGHNSDLTSIKGGGICNTGTLTITGGTISNNTTAQYGGGIYNIGNLRIQGGTNNSNTSSGDAAANGVYHNGTSLSIEGSPVINIYLAPSQTLTIPNPLTNSSANDIKIASADEHLVFTPGENTSAYKDKFSSNQTSKGIGFNSSGYAMIGTKYTITRSNVSAQASAIRDEKVAVTVSANSGYIPITLNYTDEAQNVTSLSNYPENSATYYFDMPAKNISVTATCYQGGYCGAVDEKKMKYYLQDGTLKFITDGNDFAMKNYAADKVPWRGLTYSAIDLSSNVTSISDYAFAKVDNLGKFVANTSLANVSIPSTITSIGTKAFFNCTALAAIVVDPNNANYSATNGVLFNKDGTTLICYPAGKQENADNNYTYTMSNSVTSVAEGAFAFNTHLKGIAVESGGSLKFKGVNGVLYNAEETSLICYPAGKEGASYTIAATVAEIKPYAFQSCTTLQDVYILSGSVPTGGVAMFDGTDCRILVIASLVNSYKAADYWKNYEGRITAIDMTSVTITLSSNADDYDYMGMGIPVTPAVTDVRRNFDNYSLKLNEDYIPSYSNNTALGTGTVTINGMGNYAGVTGTKTFDITKRVVISGATGNYSTYYHNETVTLDKPSGLAVYTITSVDWETGNTTLSDQLGSIPPNTPVLLYKNGNCNGTYHLKVVTASSASPSPDFKGVTADTPYNTLMSDNKAIYVIKGGQFYRATSGTLKANHCYLAMPNTDSNPAPARMMFGSGDGDATGIDVPVVEEENGNDWYSLDGRKLQKRPTQKGVYISNGKKVVIK